MRSHEEHAINNFYAETKNRYCKQEASFVGFVALSQYLSPRWLQNCSIKHEAPQGFSHTVTKKNGGLRKITG